MYWAVEIICDQMKSEFSETALSSQKSSVPGKQINGRAERQPKSETYFLGDCILIVEYMHVNWIIMISSFIFCQYDINIFVRVVCKCYERLECRGSAQRGRVTL
jgi:hypothetical protein